MKNETVDSLLEAFDTVLSEGRKPEKLITDKSTEFLNESFRQEIHSILYSKQRTKGKCSGSNQSNSLNSKLYCYFPAVNSLRYIYFLQDLLYSHDNTYHRSIGRTPATNKTNDLILNFTPENVTAFKDRVTTIHKGSSTPTKMSKRNAIQIQLNV